MSKLSQTTSERRELNALLKAKDDQAPRPISSQGAFSAYLNCAAVVVVEQQLPGSSNEESSSSCMDELWAADLNGLVSIRSVTTGQPLKDPKKPTSNWNIAGLDAVAVTGIAQVRGGAVWCSFLDGYVRGFHPASKCLLFEHKKHTGAIHTICVSSNTHSVTTVFTAGDDFRIGMWSTNADGTPNAAGFSALKAHTSSIRAMITVGDFVYTGSDDGLIRCWSIIQKGEVVVDGQYPIHELGGVKALAYH